MIVAGALRATKILFTADCADNTDFSRLGRLSETSVELSSKSDAPEVRSYLHKWEAGSFPYSIGFLSAIPG